MANAIVGAGDYPAMRLLLLSTFFRYLQTLTLINSDFPRHPPLSPASFPDPPIVRQSYSLSLSLSFVFFLFPFI